MAPSPPLRGVVQQRGRTGSGLVAQMRRTSSFFVCLLFSPYLRPSPPPVRSKKCETMVRRNGVRFNESPERASRPFDKDRDGFVLAGKAKGRVKAL